MGQIQTEFCETHRKVVRIARGNMHNGLEPSINIELLRERIERLVALYILERVDKFRLVRCACCSLRKGLRRKLSLRHSPSQSLNMLLLLVIEGYGPSRRRPGSPSKLRFGCHGGKNEGEESIRTTVMIGK